VALRVEGLVTKRAGRAASGHHGARSLGEAPGLIRGEPHPQGIHTINIIIGDLWNLATIFGNRMGLDNYFCRRLIPAKCHGPNPELFEDG
jgi:hypothetical protein